MNTLVEASAVRSASGRKPADGPFLIVSGHDFRTKRKVHLHRYAEILPSYGETRFFSVGFSWLSHLKGNARLALKDKANKVEPVDGVDCFLWRTPIHPFNLQLDLLDRAADPLLRSYPRLLPSLFYDWVRSSRFILIESGLPILLFETARQINPTARFVYFASDDLDAIGCGNFLKRELDRTIGHYQVAFALSRMLAAKFKPHVPSYYIPYGADTDELAGSGQPPFPAGLHAVSAGSTMFDRSFFEIAAPAFPEITFHVVAGGPRATRLKAPNIRLHGEMPVGDVLNWFKHAAFGIAPYEGDKVDPYFVESSQKLTQLSRLGVPAVCPHAAAGDIPGRFGYAPGDRDSIVAAIRGALAVGRLPPQPAPTWAEVAERLLAPERFPAARV